MAEANAKSPQDMSVEELDAAIADANKQVAGYRDLADRLTRVRDEKHVRRQEIEKVKREHGVDDEAAQKIVDVVVNVKRLSLSAKASSV